MFLRNIKHSSKYIAATNVTEEILWMLRIWLLGKTRIHIYMDMHYQMGFFCFNILKFGKLKKLPIFEFELCCKRTRFYLVTSHPVQQHTLSYRSTWTSYCATKLRTERQNIVKPIDVLQRITTVSNEQ